MQSGGQFQVVIGKSVPDVFVVVNEIGGFGELSESQSDVKGKRMSQVQHLLILSQVSFYQP